MLKALKIMEAAIRVVVFMLIFNGWD